VKTVELSDKDIQQLIWALNHEICLKETGHINLTQSDVIRMVKEAPNEQERAKALEYLRVIDPVQRRMLDELNDLFKRLAEVK
jgi:hypothetical protein